MDKTGLTGRYDFTLHWMSGVEGTQILRATDSAQASTEPTPVASGPSIFNAVQEQLGLTLEPAKEPDECLVTDHAEQASEN